MNSGYKQLDEIVEREKKREKYKLLKKINSILENQI